MHRVLLLRIGRDIEPSFARLSEVLEQAEQDPDFDAQRVDVAAEGVGNLSHPVEVLRQKLEDDLRGALTRLLRRIPGRSDGFLLDIVAVTQHGEPMTTAATEVACELVHRILTSQFAGVFPSQQGPNSWRFILMGVVPASGDAKRERDQLSLALRDHVMWIEENRRNNWPIARLFLLDGVTPGGLSPLGELVDQAENLVHLLMFSGIRRLEHGIQLFEAPSDDIVASWGGARLSIPPAWAQDELARRHARDMARLCLDPVRIALGRADELIRSELFSDPDALASFSAKLRRRVEDVLAASGPGTIQALLDWLKPMQTLAARLADDHAQQQRSVVSTAPASSGQKVVVPATTLVLGGSTFALAYLAIGIAALTSAGIALVTAAAGAGLMYAMLPKPAPAAPDRVVSTRQEGDPLPEEIGAQIQGWVDTLMGDLKRLKTNFETATQAFSGDEAPEPDEPRVFVTELQSPALADALYASVARDPADTLRRWIEATGTWSNLLSNVAIPTSDALHAFAKHEFENLSIDQILESPNVRAELRPLILKWVDAWQHGVAGNLEIHTLRLKDTNGYRQIFEHELLAPARFESMLLEACHQTSLRVGPNARRDFYIVTAVTDIHPDAVFTLSAEPTDDLR